MSVRMRGSAVCDWPAAYCSVTRTRILPFDRIVGDASTFSDVGPSDGTPGANVDVVSRTEASKPSPATAVTVFLTTGAFPPISLMLVSTRMLIVSPSRRGAPGAGGAGGGGG